MKTRLFVSLLLTSHVLPQAHAWQIDTNTLPAGSTVGGYVVDRQDRADVLSFYHHIYRASENAQAVMGWTGNMATCAPGTTSAAFQTHTLRRINYFRAMAGMPADITFDAKAAYLYPGDAVAAGTSKHACAQAAALITAANNVADHYPLTTATCYSAAGANGAENGNLAMGANGPEAVDSYMLEVLAADQLNLNLPVGHRRWILGSTVKDMATGDIPAIGSTLKTNCLYVVDTPRSNPPAAKFVPWPPAGHSIASLASPRWSLSYPGANFTAATVSMTDGNGAAVPVTIRDTATTNNGDNTITWDPAGIPLTTTTDLIYNVTVGGITGTGVPGSHTYQVRLVNPYEAGQAFVLSGTASPMDTTGAPYTFTPMPRADGYEVQVFTKAAATNYSNGAEGADFQAVGATVLPLTQAAVTGFAPKTGSKAFHLSFPEGGAEQAITLTRPVVFTSNSTMSLAIQHRLRSAGQKVAVDISGNDGQSWEEIWSENTPTNVLNIGATGYDKTWRTISIVPPASAMGKVSNLRLRYTKTGTSSAIGHTEYIGAFIDDITVTNCVLPENGVTTALPATSTGFSISPAMAPAGSLNHQQSYLMTYRPTMNMTRFAAAPVFEFKPLTDNTDKAAPTLLLTTTPSGSIVKVPTLNLTGTASDNVGVTMVEVNLNGAGWLPATGMVAWNMSLTLAGGNNQIQVRARDAAGNYSTITTANYTYDSTLPLLSITHPTAKVVATSAAAISGTATDASGIAKIEYRTGTSAWKLTSGTNAWTVNVVLKTGDNAFAFRATDIAGNVSTEVTHTLSLDNGLPLLVITSPKTKTLANTLLLPIAGTAKDIKGLDHVECSTNGANWIPVSGTTLWSGTANLVEGKNRIQARAVDLAGNISLLKSIEVTADTTPPTCAITLPTTATTLTNLSSIIIKGNSADSAGLALTQIRNNNGAWAKVATTAASWAKTLAVKQGTNVIEIRSLDKAGNASPIVQTTVRVDNVKPIVTITSPAIKSVQHTAVVNVSGTATDDHLLANIEVNHVKKGWVLTTVTNGQWSLPVSLLASASAQSIQVRCKDQAGNYSAISTISVVHDTILPVIKISSPKANAIVPTANFIAKGTAADAQGIVSISYQLNGGATQPCTGTKSWQASLNAIAGPNTLVIFARDAAGNTSQTSVAFSMPQPNTQAARLASPIVSNTEVPILIDEAGYQYWYIEKDAWTATTEPILEASQNGIDWSSQFYLNREESDDYWVFRSLYPVEKVGLLSVQFVLPNEK